MIENRYVFVNVDTCVIGAFIIIWETHNEEVLLITTRQIIMGYLVG